MATINAVVDTLSTELNAWRKEMEASLESVKQVVSKSIGPAPQYPYVPSNDDNTKMSGFFSQLHKMGFKDVGTLLQLLNSELKGVQDDNNYLLENLVSLLSKLDPTSQLSNQLTGAFINNLWNAVPHPPQTSLGAQYKYRDADGANNNIRSPQLGAANTPYARAAKPSVLQAVALPDPGHVFDSLMARGDNFEPHPNKISSMLFYLAIIIIHDIFRTVSIRVPCIHVLLLTRCSLTKTSISRRLAAISISLHSTEAHKKNKALSGRSRTESSSPIASQRREFLVFPPELVFLLSCSIDSTIMPSLSSHCKLLAPFGTKNI